MWGTAYAAVLAITAIAGCGNAAGQQDQSNDTRVMKLFASTWRMQLSPGEQTQLKEQKIEVPTIVIRENGTWKWRLIDETREGSVKTEEGAVVLVWEKVNGKAPVEDLTGESRATLTASEPAELLLRCGQEKAEYMFDRVPEVTPGSAEGAESPSTP